MEAVEEDEWKSEQATSSGGGYGLTGFSAVESSRAAKSADFLSSVFSRRGVIACRPSAVVVCCLQSAQGKWLSMIPQLFLTAK